MNTAVRNTSLNWLREEQSDNTCRILSNARCLSEGVDVPSLDAVLFVHSRKSKVDIVQSVGRVMRRSEGKKLGYIILPIVISAGVDPDQALNNNKQYEIVWDVLNALRSHDERMDAAINSIEFGSPTSKIEVVVEVNTLPGKSNNNPAPDIGGGGYPEIGSESSDGSTVDEPRQQELYDSVQQAIYAKIVNKCGRRTYWETWATDVAEIAQKHITRIKILIKEKESAAYLEFHHFLKELQKNINASITADETIEILAQHMITRPVFDALFSDYAFSANNPVSQSIQKVVDVLEQHNVDAETKKLDKFYASVKSRVEGVDNDFGKQKIIVELYDKFFKGAFRQLTERLGIVYTPVECVDFIIRSVNDVLQTEFKQSIGDKNTHIIDPFTGTGTFMTRLLQSGLINKQQLPYKYKNELHANEIVLLAYYIATINIESTYHAIINKDENNQHTSNKQQSAYEPFEGICLTDTFQLYENQEDLITPKLPVNSDRLNKQKKLDIKVIIGNPPYSAGQKSGNDNNQNLSYPTLDKSIENSYAKHSKSVNKNSLYDSYIRAIRWASDRIGDTGVIGFITNGGWIETNSADGLRKTLANEFSNIYIFHLRGNQRTSGELSKKEGGQIFGGGSRAPIAISILVKNPQSNTTGNIYYHDIGDYLNRDDKLTTIRELVSIQGITQQNLWQTIQPDKYHDWLNQRDDSFYDHIAIGDKKTGKPRIFENYSSGLKTNRDAWVYNASKSKLEKNIQSTIAFYNQELDRYHNSEAKLTQPDNKKDAEKYIAQWIKTDSTLIAYSRDFRYDIFDYKIKEYQRNITKALYRPFTRTNAYYSGSLMMELYQMPKIFPEAGMDNIVIGVSGRGSSIDFSCLVSNVLPDLEHVSKSQCFPLKLYEPVSEQGSKGQQSQLYSTVNNIVTADSGNQYVVSDGISDSGLQHFADYYQDATISKEDLFYYIYGLLHSADYRKRFADNLSKDLPHIPRVKSFVDFKMFAQAGRTLADLHLHYEDKECYPVDFEQGKLAVNMMEAKDFYVEKMDFKLKEDKSKIVYNHHITISDIPLEAYDYIVNGKSAIEWVMERQSITTHKDSGIVNNPNDWASETMNNPKHPLELLLKVITISIESVKIIKALPSLSLEKQK